MSVDFEIDDISNRLFKCNDIAVKRVVRSFLLKQGNQAKKTIMSDAKRKVNIGRKQKSSNKKYHSNFKRGKFYTDNDGTHKIRVYNNSRHSHLIEDGHNVVIGKRKVGYVRGKKVFADNKTTVTNTFYKDVNNLVDDLLREGFSW